MLFKGGTALCARRPLVGGGRRASALFSKKKGWACHQKGTLDELIHASLPFKASLSVMASPSVVLTGVTATETSQVDLQTRLTGMHVF